MYDPKKDKRVKILTAYHDGYEDAQYNRPVQPLKTPSARLSYLIGYKQYLQDIADVIERDIMVTEREYKTIHQD